MTSLRRWLMAAAATIALASSPIAAAHADPDGAEEFSIGPASARQAGEHDAVLFPVFAAALKDQNPDAAPDFFAYCIEVEVKGRFEVDVEPASWDEFPGKNKFSTSAEVRRKVGWIVNNSYPTISLKELRERTGITGLSKVDAITGTQYAIWYFTDGVTMKIGKNANRLRTHLTGEANEGLPEAQVRPAVTLSLAPKANTEVGAPIGPIRVEANTEPIRVTADSPYPLIDELGEEIDTKNITSGQEFYLEIPADTGAGSANVSAHVDAAQLSGSILKVPAATQDHTHAQTLILVKGETAVSTDSLTVPWDVPVLPTLATPVPPTAQVEVCEEPDGNPGAWLETVPTEGIAYDFDDESVYPGALVEVTARPLEGYEITPGEGWELREDGTALMMITIPDPDCPPEEELPPPPEPPAPEPPVEEEPPAEPPVEEEPPNESPAEPELAETGSASLGLAALAGALICGGAALTLAIRGRRTARM